MPERAISTAAGSAARCVKGSRSCREIAFATKSYFEVSSPWHCIWYFRISTSAQTVETYRSLTCTREEVAGGFDCRAKGRGGTCRSYSKRQGRSSQRREREQVAAVAVPVSPPPMPPPSTSPSMARRKSSNISAVAIGTVTLQVASNLPTASSSQVYTCSANQDNMQQCTMLSTDDEFPWGTVMLMTFLLTTLFTTTIIFMPKLISRWFRRRDILVMVEEEEE